MPRSLGINASLLKEVTCRNCAHRIEYVPADVRPLHRGTDWSGSPDGADGFNCPNCGKEIYTKSW